MVAPHFHNDTFGTYILRLDWNFNVQASTNFNSVHTDVTVIIVVINATRVGGGVEPHPLTLERLIGFPHFLNVSLCLEILPL